MMRKSAKPDSGSGSPSSPATGGNPTQSNRAAFGALVTASREEMNDAEPTVRYSASNMVFRTPPLPTPAAIDEDDPFFLDELPSSSDAQGSAVTIPPPAPAPAPSAGNTDPTASPNSGLENTNINELSAFVRNDGRVEVIPPFCSMDYSKIVEKQGYLCKEGRKVRNWKRREFFLRGFALSYFSGPNKLKGEINLDEDGFVVAITKRKDGKDMLELKLPGSQRVLLLMADPSSANPQKDLEEWNEILSNKLSLIKYERAARALGLSPHRSIRHFFSTPKCTVLDVSSPDVDTPLPKEALHSISGLISTHTTLKFLGLRSCQIGDEGIEVLVECLSKNTSISTLCLQHNDIGAKGADNLAKIFKENRTITSLDLSHNLLDNKAMEALAVGLRLNKSLQDINWSGNVLGDEGVRILVGMLGSVKPSIVLSALKLQDNRIEDKGAVEIANLLTRDKNITNVDVSNNRIQNEGAIAISNALLKNVHVSFLNLEHNEIGYQGTKELCHMLKVNKTITTALLGSNSLDQSAFTLDRSGWQFPVLELVQS